tara:strand:+ start:325 stop:486 length:162 start_codon:yes stop_codon:yes gene_type:complete
MSWKSLLKIRLAGWKWTKKANVPVIGIGIMKDEDDDKDNQVPVIGSDYLNHHK